MSVSFGLKGSSVKRATAAPLAAFAEPEDEPEPDLSEAQKLAESQRLQVTTSNLSHSCIKLRSLTLWHYYLIVIISTS